MKHDQPVARIEALYHQTLQAIERLDELSDLYKRQAKIYERLLHAAQCGELPDEFDAINLEQLGNEHSLKPIIPKKPDDMKLSKYKDEKLSDVILSIFDKAQADGDCEVRISTDELVQLIYLAQTKEEMDACKSSLTAVLNRCVKSEQLIRVKPGVFVRNLKKRDQNLLFLYKQGTQIHAL